MRGICFMQSRRIARSYRRKEGLWWMAGPRMTGRGLLKRFASELRCVLIAGGWNCVIGLHGQGLLISSDVWIREAQA